MNCARCHAPLSRHQRCECGWRPSRWDFGDPAPEMERARVLIQFGHGLGDVCQFTVILKHLRRYRPLWDVHVRCGRGKHTALLGLCNHVHHDHEPTPDGPWDARLRLAWNENYCRFTDRPNSKITNCLEDVFGIPWDRELGQYTIIIGTAARDRAAAYLASIGCRLNDQGRYTAVVLHYEGNTSPHKKNLSHWQAEIICAAARSAGRVPVILDWDRRSPLPDNRTIFNPNTGNGDIWGGFGSGDAETIAALVSLSEAYIGIDSGPGKAASATDTPVLICWRRHHPIQFHDPACSTTHLVPVNHRQIPPCCDEPRVADWFEANYAYRTYDGERDLAWEARNWLCEVFGVKQIHADGIMFGIPQGIGDVTWALHKIRAVAGERPIDIALLGPSGNEIHRRSIPFLRRFPFIRDVNVPGIPCLADPDHMTDDAGRYIYEPDGERGGIHYLCPNHTLERGGSLADWLPDVPLDWSVMDRFDWSGTERGAELAEAIGPFAAFYLGPETGNVDEGHCRGFQWEPRQWVELGACLRNRGLEIVVVGASYDRSYWDRYVKAGVRQADMSWWDLLGKLEIGETLALLRRAAAFVSYQCGLGICTHYFGGRVAMWWRQDGDSLHPRHKICFDERMAHSWCRPEFRDRYIPLYYKRQTVSDIVAEMEGRGWIGKL